MLKVSQTFDRIMRRMALAILMLGAALLAACSALELALRPPRPAMSTPAARPTGSSDPIRIIYPTNGSVIANDWATLLVEVNLPCALFDLEVLKDGKVEVARTYNTAVGRVEPHFYFLPLSPGKHTIAVRATGEAIPQCQGIREYRKTIDLVAHPGPLRFKPLDEDTYRELRWRFDRTIAGFSPVAWTAHTALIRTRSDSLERVWVVPREDEEKALQIIDGPLI